jgi:hypothetical protein
MARPFAFSCLLLVAASSAFAQPKDLTIPPKFIPTTEARIALPAPVLGTSVEVRVEDGRGQADPLVLGEGTDDDDRLFTIRCAGDVPTFVGEALKAMVVKAGLRQTAPPDRILRVRLTKFTVSESNKALGSTYSAEAVLAFTLTDASGAVLRESATTGSASRYGRARSVANVGEVLSDALTEAFSATLNDRALHAAWTGTAPRPAPVAADGGGTPAERLERIKDLLQKGLITQQEHDRIRAEILKSL